MRNFLISCQIPVFGLMACGEPAETETEVVQCDLSDGLTDSEWLFLREINGQDPEPDAKVVGIVSTDGKMSANTLLVHCRTCIL